MSEILLSQLAHVELISPKPQETTEWMVDVLGLEETHREGQSVYLRGWAEWLHSSMIVTEGPRSELGHIAWRTYGPDDVDTIAQRFQGSEEAIGWVESSVGHGSAYRYHAPAGRHVHEVFWDTELYKAPPEKAEPDFQNRPQRFSTRGAAVRYLDHVTIATPDIAGDIAFYKRLGHRHTLQICPEPGFAVFATITCNAIRSCHDLGLVPDFSGATARANHLAYRVDQRRRSWPRARRSSSVPASTEPTRSHICTCASRAASGSRSTPAVGRTISPTGRRRPGRRPRARRPSGRTSRCPSR
jgi:catechol 2,3-dioxygenase